jgi:hypothetical protein
MKKLIICALYVLASVICFSQTTTRQPSKFDPHKLEFGGNFGLSFGNDATSIVVAPQIGYAFDPHFSAGIGVNYSYYHYSSESLNYMGLDTYARVKPVQPIVFQVQPEIYRVWGSSGGSSVSKLVPALLLGGGVLLPVGSGGVSLMLYYDVVQNNYSPYGNRVFFSVGYTFFM